MFANKKNTFIVLTLFLLISITFVTGFSGKIIQSTRSLYTKIQLFQHIVNTIRKDYVESKDPENLIDDAIQGMVSKLDPHSTYFSTERYKQWNQNFEGYTGIGVTFDIIRNKITIMSVIKDGPSEKVGLLPGDRIIAINGESSIGLSRDEVPQKLMGPKGSKVEVALERNGWKIPRERVITRDEVHLQSIPYIFMLQPDVGYIGIIRFSATTGKELEKGLEKLKAQGMEKLILDLRNNGGGYLGAAVDVSDRFVPGGRMIVYTKGRTNSSHQEFHATHRNVYHDLPVIILIDRISASASEIVAGAIQDWDRGLIVGETSFGKGLVQTPYPFSDGSALIMTTSRYYTPSGRLIQRSYDDKSLETYYHEIANDSLRKNWEKDSSRPIYKTLVLKRKVLGGGGITPDYFLKSKQDTVSQIVRELLFSRDRLFFTFVEDYVKTHSGLKMDLSEFLRNYKPNGKLLQQFIGYIREMGFEISNNEILDNKKNLQYFLKQALAKEIWNDEAAYKVQLLRDHRLLETLQYLPQAESILQKAYPKTVQR